MKFVFEQLAAPGVHALVIGVGDYPWLPGGTEPKTFAKAQGMGQLTSAPVSARAVATWFLSTFAHPTLPRASLDLLVSDAESDQFTDPANVAHQLRRATFDNVKNAILAWRDRGNQHPDNIMLFFFCGHGLGKGNQTILLAEDFGSLDDLDSLQLAVDFDQLYLGMDRCKARRQCFFVDACRTGTPYALNTLTFFGNPVIVPGAKVDPLARSAPVYYATVPGATAYGRTKASSFFTEALLSSFQGAGADDVDGTGTWQVNTDVLHRGVHAYLRRSVSRTAAQGQLSMANGIAGGFTLHKLAGAPIVPVEVTCMPEDRNPSCQLQVQSVPAAGVPLTPASPKEGPWDLDLALGQYQFTVQLPAPAPVVPPEARDVRPPHRRVEIQVP